MNRKEAKAIAALRKWWKCVEKWIDDEKIPDPALHLTDDELLLLGAARALWGHK